MATEVLRPQNCLVDQVRHSPVVFHRRRNGYFSKTNAKFSRRPLIKPEQKRTANAISGGEMVMEKVTILRRGDSLKSRLKHKITPSNKLPEIDAEVYAGSATFIGSPAPSSLPLPSFSRKVKNQVVLVDESATRDLRRLLRLEL